MAVYILLGGNGKGQGAKRRPPPPDWGKFGLSQEPVEPVYSTSTNTGGEAGYQHTDADNKNELFQEDKVGMFICFKFNQIKLRSHRC